MLPQGEYTTILVSLSYDQCALLTVLLELFDDPESFVPERYLLSEFGTKPGAKTEGLRDNLHFGAGRVSNGLSPPLLQQHLTWT